MRTDSEIRVHGIQVLVTAMGEVEAERFITLLNRGRFDYTEWRKSQWAGETVATLIESVRMLQQKQNPELDQN
ncbi:MAG: hypothetical protein H7833_11895 [Magnetococcus sp. DMHC-1]|nr:hypothetical protein [Magnetococcales bacterium]